MRPTQKSTFTVLVAGAILFVLSASGQPYGPWSSGPSWLGTFGWFGFLVCALVLIVSGLYLVVSSIRHRNGVSPR